ncbi:hypothetical protein E8E13_007438 [Curvularia kusanoi]|uniref:Large ribosomal subunit protein P1 n=1 Tax=Curvularia kusanoi TaxID=90978 RepID=A0A9P4TK12_CURKU|nr:hypothetical protein E8E13_007438 [Curvularia kusanoi]
MSTAGITNTNSAATSQPTASSAPINPEQAVSFAALILADENLTITPEKLQTLLKAAGITEVEPIWTTLFANALKDKDVKEILTAVATSSPKAGGEVRGEVDGDGDRGSESDRDCEKGRLWWQRHTTGVTNEAFSLIKLLRNFVNSRSTDPRDKVYGLLGLVAGSSPYDFVKADYTKSVLDIAVDLVKSFRLFDYAAQPRKSEYTAKIIRRALGLTEVQFAAHILRRSLKPYWNPEWSRISSLQLTYTRENVDSKGLWFTESAPSLTLKAANPNLLRLLSLRSVPELVVFENESMLSPPWARFRKESESLGGWMKVRTTYRDAWIDIDNAIDRSKDEKGIVPYTDASCTSFVGTNGFYGVTLDQVEPFDCAFVFAGTESTEVVLLLRPIQEETAQGAKTHWKVVGTAVLFAQELVSDANWVEPLPDERTNSKVTIRGNDARDLLSRVYEEVQLKMHPYHMEEFVRCGLLESTIAF